MNRFSEKKKQHVMLRSLAMPVLLFALVLGLFGYGLQSVTKTTEREQLRSVRQAVTRAVVQCYAIEGAYPASLGYLEEHYGLTIDHDKYLVDYRTIAENLMPDVTVLPRDLSGVPGEEAAE